MGTFTLKGKIISKDQLPLKGLKIQAYDDDPLLNPDDFLGEAVTDLHGFFRIEFDESKFKEFLEVLEGTPDVYLVVKDNQGNNILTTKVMQTKNEIEYHIRIVDNIPDPHAVDFYSGNASRIMNHLANLEAAIYNENMMDLELLRNGDTSKDIRDRLQNLVDGSEDRNNNLNRLRVVVTSLIDPFLEEMRLGEMDHDGPQVPRQPRRESYDEVIMWPRKEEFKWG